MKKILISLAIIGLVGVTVVGLTGAWWSDTGTSHNTSFSTGSMDLQLKGCNDAGGNCDAWRNEVYQTWDYENMIPGGEPVGDFLSMRNNGSTPADWLKIAATATSSGGDVDKAMRITKLEYNSESLLQGGAGATIPEYLAPAVEDCDIMVRKNNTGDSVTIQGGIDLAKDGDLVCVMNGIYVENVLIGNSTLSTNITLASLNGPSGVTIDGTGGIGTIMVNKDMGEVTIKGFTVMGGTNVGIAQSMYQKEGTKVHVLNNVVKTPVGGWSANGNSIQVAGDSSTVIGNEVEVTGYKTDISTDSTTGIMIVDGSNIEVKHNYVEYVSKSDLGILHKGIAVLAWTNSLTANNNVVENNTVIGVEKGITVQTEDGNASNTRINLNVVKDNSVGISAIMRKSNKPSGIVANWNDITGNDIGVDALDHDGWFDARHNWWGDYTPSDHVSGNVGTGNYLGGAYLGFINGVDNNSNGFADLNDFSDNVVVVEDPNLNPSNEGVLGLWVQLDGPTSTDEHQGETVSLDVDITMGQGPISE